jgi:rhodanese-related sulfurtransferase
MPDFSALLVTIFVPALRYTPLWEPVIHNVDPSLIAEKMKANPDGYLFIDVRPQEMYQKLHAKGAQNIPIHLFYDKRTEFPKSGKEIVLICSGGRLAGVAYYFLEHFGFRNIMRVEGGVENWQAQGLPVVLGDLLDGQS